MKKARPITARNPPTPIAIPGSPPANAMSTIKPKPTPITVTAGTPVASGARSNLAALETVHRAIETAGIDLRRRHETALDHGNALANLELAHPRFHDCLNNGENEGPDNGCDRNPERADDHVFQLPLHGRFTRRHSNN